MKKYVKMYCTKCEEITDFLYDGEQWVCQNCGSYNSQGDIVESIPRYADDEEIESE